MTINVAGSPTPAIDGRAGTIPGGPLFRGRVQQRIRHRTAQTFVASIGLCVCGLHDRLRRPIVLDDSPGEGGFIPAGCSHSIRMWGNVAVRSLYFPPGLKAAALAFEECRVLSVTPLLRELILRVIESRALDLRLPLHQSLLNVLLDEMNIAPVAPLMLPLPEDARARAVARHLLDCPAAEETLDDLSRRYGAGRRTLERLFSQQTGLSFGLWRQKVRLLESIRLLAEGKSVTEAALDTGYSSVSAFIAAFRNTFGCTPARY